MTTGVPTCTCGSTDFEDGFIDEVATGQGRVRWIAGEVEIGIFGNASRRGEQRVVLAMRCTACSRLQLVASQVV